jgi:putative transposase
MTTFDQLRWAYQLHYYVCFRTRRRIPHFQATDRRDLLSKLLAECCLRHQYHLLEHRTHPDHLRCLLSLKPDQSTARVVNTLKSNLSRLLCAELAIRAPLWAAGYLARSVGRVRTDAVQAYLSSQAEHHGYASRVNPPVSSYRARTITPLTGEHSVFDLRNHVVLATHQRHGVFGARLGAELIDYFLAVARKHKFAIDQVTVLPDHIHLLIRLVPRLSIEQCVLYLLRNSQHWLAKHYARWLLQAKAVGVWESSAYAGTCGRVTTAEIKSFLASTRA